MRHDTRIGTSGLPMVADADDGGCCCWRALFFSFLVMTISCLRLDNSRFVPLGPSRCFKVWDVPGCEPACSGLILV